MCLFEGLDQAYRTSYPTPHSRVEGQIKSLHEDLALFDIGRGWSRLDILVESLAENESISRTLREANGQVVARHFWEVVGDFDGIGCGRDVAVGDSIRQDDPKAGQLVCLGAWLQGI